MDLACNERMPTKRAFQKIWIMFAMNQIWALISGVILIRYPLRQYNLHRTVMVN